MTHAPDHDADRGPVTSSNTAPVQPEDGTTGPRSSARDRRKRQQLPIWQEMGLLLGIALVLAIVIKAFFMQAFYIPSASMNDTLVKNDRILVQKVSYWGGEGPHRGDIVVFADPGGWLDPAESQAAEQPGGPGARAVRAVPDRRAPGEAGHRRRR